MLKHQEGRTTGKEPLWPEEEKEMPRKRRDEEEETHG
jgi:hypothetical protein